MISSLELVDALLQPCLVLEATEFRIRFANRAMASTLAITPRKLLRDYKNLTDLFPRSSEALISCVREAVTIGGESNSTEQIEEIGGSHLTFVARAVLADDNTVFLILSDLSVEKKLQEKYAVLQRSLAAYSQRMRSDIEFKDFIVDRLPRLMTEDLAHASRVLLEIKDDMAKREDASGTLWVKSIAGSFEQLSYVSKNISQLRSPYKVERKLIKVSELVKFLNNFFLRSFNSRLNAIIVKSLLSEGEESCLVDPHLTAFSLRNLFAFMQNKAFGVESTSTLTLKFSKKGQHSMLEFTGTVETIEGKLRQAGEGRDSGLELLVANKIAKVMGGNLSFLGASVLSFQLNLPASEKFVLHKKKPLYDKIFFFGVKSSVPSSLMEFLEVENLDIKFMNNFENLLTEGACALIIPAGALTKDRVAKLVILNSTSVKIIPIVRHDNYDQLLYAFEELDVTNFLLEPLTVDGLRAAFFDEAETKGLVFSSKD